MPRVGYLLAYFRFPAGYVLTEDIEPLFVLCNLLFRLLDFFLCVLEGELCRLKIPLAVTYLLGVPLRLTFQLRKLHRVHAHSISRLQPQRITLATAIGARLSNMSGMTQFAVGFLTSAAIARAAFTFISSVILVTRWSSAPRKMPGNASELFI